MRAVDKLRIAKDQRSLKFSFLNLPYFLYLREVTRIRAKISTSPGLLLLWSFFLFICYWFKVYFTSQPVAAVDLPSHISIIEQLRALWFKGNLNFYDATAFTGWPALQFYGSLPFFFTAILSAPLGLITDEPARLACHLLLVFGAASFVFSFYFAAKPLANEILGSDQDSFPKLRNLVLASGCCFFSFWFLNHDSQWFGVGAAAVMNIGLYGQLFGWHSFFLYIGTLLRFQQTNDKHWAFWLALFFGLNFLCHTLTAVYVCFIGALSCLWFSNRLRMCLIHLLGLALIAFWLFPFLTFMGDYTAYDPWKPSGDILKIFFRYPLQLLFSEVEDFFQNVNAAELLVWFLAAVALVSSRVRRTRYLASFFVFILLGILIFSSQFVASSIPLSLHYYRFISYNFLFLCLLLAVIPLVIFDHISQSSRYSAPWTSFSAITLCLILLLGLYINTHYPHYERERIQASTDPQHLENEEEVLKYFAHQEKKGRVYFEYFNNYRRYPFLSAHYMPANLYKKTGFQAIPNLYLQQSAAYRMLVVSATLLGAQSYHVPLLFTDRARLEKETLVKQLRSFGITHLVVGTRKFKQALSRLISEPPQSIGPYTIFELQDPPFSSIDIVENKRLIGYYDAAGNLPFHLVQYYFYAREELTSNFELVRIENPSRVPEQIEEILFNTEEGRKLPRALRNKTIYEIRFRSQKTLRHYQVRYPTNIELDTYNEMERYFDRSVRLISRITAAKPPQQKVASLNSASLQWSEDFQSFKLTGLEAGQVYRINYSYFPYWVPSNGFLLRGSGERMFFFADKETAEMQYAQSRFLSTWLGFAFSFLGVFLLRRIASN